MANPTRRRSQPLVPSIASRLVEGALRENSVSGFRSLADRFDRASPLETSAILAAFRVSGVIDRLRQNHLPPTYRNIDEAFHQLGALSEHAAATH